MTTTSRHNAHSWGMTIIIVSVVMAMLNARAVSQCTYEWLPGDGIPGLNGSVLASTTWDPDGKGPQPEFLVVGGYFTVAGTILANSIATWDGTNFATLGAGIDGTVFDLTVFDDGNGPALYAGGQFTNAGGQPANYIAKWDGTSWSPVGSGLNNTVNALCVFDDGTGPALYASGQFTKAGGITASRIAKWNGKNWSRLGTGMSQSVFTMTVFDDGTGPALYAGGSFHGAGGVTASRIAKWNGKNWSALGSGVSGPVSSVHAMTVFDDGSGGGPALYVGGDFDTAGDLPAVCIAKWDGSTWSSLSMGLNNGVRALTVFDDGNGPKLYAGGLFERAYHILGWGETLLHIARWDGTSWSDLSIGVSNGVLALTVFNDGTGPALYVGGQFQYAGESVLGVSQIAKWDGSNWLQLRPGMNAGIIDLTVFDDNDGPALYAAGGFTSVSNISAKCIAKWDGSNWSPLGSGLNATAYTMTTWQDSLYVGGSFTTAGNVVANRIARWDGKNWHAVQNPPLFENPGFNGEVLALTAFDDGNGSALYAGGAFTRTDGVTVNFIAKWNGTNWSPLGSGMDSIVLALTVFDDGNGPALYAGGWFSTSGGITTNSIAKWNGTTWSSLGAGMNEGVWTFAVFNDGKGPALYAGGLFTSAGGVSANRIARWDGSTWSTLGSGMDANSFPLVTALTVFDDGINRPALYAGGYFTIAGGVEVNRIARWDGITWSPLGSGMDEAVGALSAYDDGTGPALYVGGDFATVDGEVSGFWARWGSPSTPCLADLNCDDTVNVNDLLLLIGSWGQGASFADLNANGVVNVDDLLLLIGAWGPCP